MSIRTEVTEQVAAHGRCLDITVLREVKHIEVPRQEPEAIKADVLPRGLERLQELQLIAVAVEHVQAHIEVRGEVPVPISHIEALPLEVAAIGRAVEAQVHEVVAATEVPVAVPEALAEAIEVRAVHLRDLRVLDHQVPEAEEEDNKLLDIHKRY